MRRLMLPIAGLAISATLAVPALAQDATPEGEGGRDSARVIDPAECTVEPMAADDLYAVLGLDESEALSPSTTNLDVPLGEPAPNDVRTAIAETARQWIACLNASDNLRIAALLTDTGAVDYFGDQSALDEATAEQTRGFLAGPAEARDPSGRIRYIALTDASILDDGRAVAFVVLNEPVLPPSGPETLLLVFSQQDDDRWLIDGFIDFTIVPPTAATPEAGATPEA